MKRFAMIFAAVAGLSLCLSTTTAEANHRCRGGGGFYGGYSAPVYRHGGYYGRGFASPGFHRGYYNGWNRGFYGRPVPRYGRYGGFYGPGFGIQTRGFSLFVR